VSTSEGNSNWVRGCLLLVFLGATGLIVLAGIGWLTLRSDAPGTDVAGEPQGWPAREQVAPSADPASTPAGAAVARIRQRGVLLVGMDSGEPPFTGTPPMYFPNARGEPDGFDTALARVIAARAGVKDLKVVHAKYSGLEDLLLAPDQVDLMISGYTPTETSGITFSEPYLEYGLCLVVPATSKVRTTADLFGKRVGTFDDDAAVEEVQRLVKGYTDLVRLEDGYWDQLAAGRFDAFLYDYPYTAAELNQWMTANPSRKGSLRIAQYNLTDSTYAVGVRTGDADLLALVNEAIRSWRASDDYATAVKTYLKSGFAVEPTKGARVHVVVAGDTLSGVAAQELGSKDQWTRLWELNRDRFPNPHLIEVGDQIVLPNP
jgi:ABC-type amino acid transport substrate-binding protein